jgi:uncharacterized protein (TIGR02453 family)
MKNVLLFLEDLKNNNSREWFEENKSRYQQAKLEFESFIGELIPRLAEIDKGVAGLEPKHCVFRIYRDVRFSKDKSPYKVNMGAAMVRGGRKSPYAGYYLHIEPGSIFAGGGIWMPDAAVLKAMRQEVYYNAPEFKKILQAADFRKYFTALEGEKLKRPPRDFPADFPDIELLKHKSYVVMHPFSDQQALKDDFITQVLDVFAAQLPFNNFINKALTDI